MNAMQKQVITQGKPLSETGKALILVPGRGASAESILELARHLPVADFTHFAPQATNHTWYPYSFMAPETQNQPYLDQALAALHDLVKSITGQGISVEKIYLAGRTPFCRKK